MKMRAPMLRLAADELIVDNFAGGGGASTGIEWPTGRSPDIAINHDPEAIAMHKANHPTTKHYVGDVWDFDPKKELRDATGKRMKVGLAWFSPDCTFHSKARGAKPFRDRDKAKRRRGLAWVVTRWARAVKPRVLMLENVEEFEDWGPLTDDGKIDPERKGFTFRRWVKQLENLGYEVQWRQLRACDYGAPTTRKRLFIIARCDGRPIVWPTPTHGPGRRPYKTAADCIDWSIPCPSIFGREKELSENTLKRIARGLKKYVLEAEKPFIVPNQGRVIGRIGEGAPANDSSSAQLVAPGLIQQSWGERKGQAPRCLNIEAPIGTVVGQGIKHAVVSAFLAKHFGGEHSNGTPKSGAGSAANKPIGTITTRDHNHVVTSHLVKLRGGLKDHVNTAQSVEAPVPTLTAGGTHVAEVRAFLIKYYNSDGKPDQHQQVDLPLHTIPTKARFGLVTIHGVDYQIVDIGMRMLTPRELFRAQGFPDSYTIDIDLGEVVTKSGKRKRRKLSKGGQVRMCGNSVSPYVPDALIAANFADDAEQVAVA